MAEREKRYMAIASETMTSLLRQIARSWNAYLKLLVAVTLVLALVFRLGNLSVKPYWTDEVFTSIRISGYSSGVVSGKIDRQLVPVEDLYQYRDVDKSGRSWRNTVGALVGRPEHAPLYFLLARGWAQIFGSSASAMRAMPALVSLLALPLFYWISRLLFNSSETANVTLCLACVSPILIRQAQEARPYSLWIVGVLASSALLLSALRSDKHSTWWLYSLSVAFTFLTHLLSTFVFVAHGLYVFILHVQESARARRSAAAVDTTGVDRTEIEPQTPFVDRSRFRHFRQFFLIGMVPVLPWLALSLVRIDRVRSSTKWHNNTLSLERLAMSWTKNASYLLFYWIPEHRWLIFAGLLSLLIGFALCRLISSSHVSQWLLPVLFCALPSVLLVSSDLILGGLRSIIPRYFILTYLGAILILGFGLGFSPLRSGQIRRHNTWTNEYRWICRLLFHGMLVAMIAASVQNLYSPVWWKTLNLPLLQTSQIVMRSPTPATVVSDTPIGNMLAFSYQLRPTDRILWFYVKEIETDTIFDNVETFFLYEPSEQLLAKVEEGLEARQLRLEPTEEDSLFHVVAAP